MQRPPRSAPISISVLGSQVPGFEERVEETEEVNSDNDTFFFEDDTSSTSECTSDLNEDEGEATTFTAALNSTGDGDSKAGVRRTRSNFSSQPQLDEPNIKFGRTVPALHRLQLDLSHLQDQENSPEQIVIGSSSLKCLEDEITHLEGVGLTFKPKDHAKSNKRKVFKAIRRQSRTKSFSKRHPSVSSPRSSPAASPRKRPGSTIGNLVNRVNLSSSSQVHNPLGNLPKIWKSHTPRTSLSSSPTQSKLADIAPSLLLNSLSNVDDLQTEVDVVHLRKRRDAEQRQRELLLERRNARTKDKKV